MMNCFFSSKVLKVSQPFGDFYVASIPASILIDLCYSFPAVYGDDTLNGIQRNLNKKRVEAISEYCKTMPVFPSSIILSANIYPSGEVVAESDMWYVSGNDIIIPKQIPIASIIDGQHRLEGIKLALADGAKDFDILCTIYMGLPAPQQAEIFATINFNQQKVDKSLAYQLFGYDLNVNNAKEWSPDTLAIYLTRLLDKETRSPFCGRISFGMSKESNLNEEWSVSTAVMVDSISKLISKNATMDRYKMHRVGFFSNKERKVLQDANDNSPLRPLYISYKDKDIYEIILNYFKSVNNHIWLPLGISVMNKTIAIQALFDVLLEILKSNNVSAGDIHFDKYLSRVDLKVLSTMNINYSGVGRIQIRRGILDMLSL